MEGLSVRHMPFGSTTKLQDLQSRLSQRFSGQKREAEGMSQEKSKRRKSDATETSVVVGGTPSKHKKSKKDKKSHE